MSERIRTGWALLALLGFALYLLQASVYAAIQYNYFISPNKAINVPQPLAGLLTDILKNGILGLNAIVSIYATLIAIYLSMTSLLTPGKTRVRLLLVIYAAIQFLLGNTGFIAGLALMTVAAILAGEKNGVKAQAV